MQSLSSSPVRRQLQIGSVTTLVAAVFAAPLSAQTFDLNRALRSLPVPQEARGAVRAGAQIGGQMMAANECERLKRWVSSVPTPAMARGPDQWLPYVEDTLFSGHFGKTYDQLTVDDLRNVQQAQGECRRQGLFTPTEAQAVSAIWNPSTQSRLAQQLVAMRSQRNEFAGLTKELDTLQPTEADYRRIDSIKARGDALARSMSADEQRAFAQRVDHARERVGVPVEQQRVDAAIASASGASGIVQLAGLHDELSRSRLGSHGEPLRARLRTHVTTLSAEVAASERASTPPSVATSAPTLEALESSRRWSVDFVSRYQKVFALAPPLDELRREVLAQRSALVSRLQEPLLAQVNAARTPQEVSATLTRYLLDEEQRDGAARVIKVAADERSAALQRVARNESVFGHQGGAGAQAAAPAAAVNDPTVARCDALAADPNDPTRAAPGVADDAISTRAAITACTEAAQAQPGLPRLRFQLGRALLAGGQQKEAVAAFQQAAKGEHPGALAYLGTAHRYGAGGLPKSQTKADELHNKASNLGYGTQTTARAASAGSAPKTAGDMKGNYEQPAIVKAVYFGDASLLPKERLFTVKYLLTQAEILAGDCQSFKLSEIRGFQENLMRSAMPKTQDEMVEQGARNLLAVAQAMRNPQAMVDLGVREQRLEDAPAYAAHDIVEFTKLYGACGSASLERYTRNMRNYFQSPQASLR